MVGVVFQAITGFAIVLALLGSFILVLGNVLPVATMATSIASASTYLSAIYSFMPITISALLFIFFSLLSVETGIGTYKIVKWVYSKFPGIT